MQHNLINKLIAVIKQKLGIPSMYTSETSKVRHLVLSYCMGKGCDIGFGGDKIKKTDCDGIDYATPYAYTGKDKVNIACDVMKEPIPVSDNTYDYVYTSHLIEDFENTTMALKEFIRILKNQGHLILVFPDQKVYEAHCIKTGQPLNSHHVHANMGSAFMIDRLNELNDISYEILLKSDLEIDYNVVLVLKIQKK
jgi:ubiquinone/menaquinone biosynthesis C-methylase UbiE